MRGIYLCALCESLPDRIIKLHTNFSPAKLIVKRLFLTIQSHNLKSHKVLKSPKSSNSHNFYSHKFIALRYVMCKVWFVPSKDFAAQASDPNFCTVILGSRMQTSALQILLRKPWMAELLCVLDRLWLLCHEWPSYFACTINCGFVAVDG